MNHQIRSFLICLVVAATFNNADAAVLSPTGREVKFVYSASFLARLRPQDMDHSQKLLEKIDRHSQHLVALLKSPQMIRKYDLNPNKLGGVAGPKLPFTVTSFHATPMENGIVEITYRAEGRMLAHLDVVQRWLDNGGGFTVPMPYDLPAIEKDFDDTWVKCTDKEFPEWEFFWYFYNPFQKGCTKLTESPLAQSVRVHVERAYDTDWYKARLSHQQVPLDELRGDNGNGNLFSIFMFFGFDESSTNPRDLGRKSFEKAGDLLTDEFDFTLAQEEEEPGQIFRRFDKILTTPDGRKIPVQIHQLLIETEYPASSTTGFAQAWRKAMDKADVIIYEGHSGLGDNLALKNMGKMLGLKDGTFPFRQDKLQLIFLDACYGYSSYVQPYSSDRPRSTVDIISYALESPFEGSIDVLSVFLEHLFSFDGVLEWSDLLTDMENTIEDEKLLISAGGLW